MTLMTLDRQPGGENQAGCGLVMKHPNPSSENIWEAHPLHHQEEELDHSSVICLHHIIAANIGRLPVLVHVINGGDDVIGAGQDVLLFLPRGQLVMCC